MNLKQLLNIHGAIQWGEKATQEFVPSSLHIDSRGVKPGGVFFAIRGLTVDGHNFLEQAVEKGASVLVVDDSTTVPKDFLGTYIVVLDTRLALHLVTKSFMSNPAEDLISIAVTGTNGKTSCSYILEAIFNHSSLPCGVLGTIDQHLGKQYWPTNLTTPGDLQLQTRLKQFVELGAKAFVVEASSHALEQKRLMLKFDAAIFTNLSRDHLDYHGDMDEYFRCKELLFTQHLKGAEQGDAIAIINTDDPYVAKTVIPREVMKVTYGKSDSAAFKIKDLKSSIEGLRFKIVGADREYKISSKLLGEFNAYNITGCFAAAISQGLSPETTIRAISNFAGIPGRLERVANKTDVHCFVDYAHTPDALRKSLETLSAISTRQQRIVCVFGCGGDRDEGKRPEMGAVAQEIADVVVLTSDNPRSEDPSKIISDIEKGMKGGTLYQELDRKKAIELGLSLAKKGDILLVAGKGHEDYQIVGTETLDFSDKQVLESV